MKYIWEEEDVYAGRYVRISLSVYQIVFINNVFALLNTRSGDNSNYDFDKPTTSKKEVAKFLTERYFCPIERSEARKHIFPND
jgi:hypothetical protein